MSHHLMYLLKLMTHLYLMKLFTTTTISTKQVRSVSEINKIMTALLLSVYCKQIAKARLK